MLRDLPPFLRNALATVVFVLLLAGRVWAQGNFKILHAFTGGSDGGGVWDSIIFDRKGNLYGTTSGGGVYGYGTVFELTPGPSSVWTETVLHSFPDFSSVTDGDVPFGSVAFDSRGNLYGTTSSAGAYGHGIVFRLTPSAGGWNETVLYNFCPQPGCMDGGSPYAGPTVDSRGNVYGTGAAVWELSYGGGGWIETPLHYFCSLPQCADGNVAFAGVILDTFGNLYGTTEAGGAYGVGTVYEVTQISGQWQETVLQSFPSSQHDGQEPGVGELVFDTAGSLYGTTFSGGQNLCPKGGCGTIFKLAPGAGGQWTEAILYNFRDGASGNFPGAGVIVDKLGNLYGATTYGGSPQCDCGVVYKLARLPGGNYQYHVLHTFTGFDGAQPDANLTLHNGNLYGTTATGGPGGAGVVFEITLTTAASN